LLRQFRSYSWIIIYFYSLSSLLPGVALLGGVVALLGGVYDITPLLNTSINIPGLGLTDV